MRADSSSTIAVCPPEYFPGLGYLALARHVDRFVLADTFAYSRRSMQNRSRLRTPQGWQWITIPLKGGQTRRPIAEVEIETRERWIEKHWRSFQYNYRSTPYFEFYEPQLEPFFDKEWTRMGACTCASVALLCELLELSTERLRASELPGRPDTLPAILEAVGAEEDLVLAPPEQAAHDARTYAVEEGPRIRAFHFETPRYRQNFDGFEPGMSCADLIFSCGPETLQMLRENARVASP